MRVAGVFGFVGGFLLAYQRSSCRSIHPKPTAFRPFEFRFLVRFWGWSENEREATLDLAELRARAQQNLPLYGESDQPEWVQQAAYSNSVWSQLKFREFLYLAPKLFTYSLMMPAEAFPMFVLIQ